MARNKYPEETVKKILDVAERLFAERGYEHTTMADIVAGLDGLTKGAVYHHFKSKEDVFEAVFERANRSVVTRAEEILADSSLTGIEKLRALDESSAAGPSADMLRAMRPSSDPIASSRLLAREYLDALDVAHRYVEPAIREGVADGTVSSEYPRETAEVMLLLANLWMVPLYHPLADKAEFERRAAVLVRVMHALGVDLVDWESFDPARMWDDSWGELARDLAGEGAAEDGGNDSLR